MFFFAFLCSPEKNNVCFLQKAFRNVDNRAKKAMHKNVFNTFLKWRYCKNLLISRYYNKHVLAHKTRICYGHKLENV